MKCPSRRAGSRFPDHHDSTMHARGFFLSFAALALTHAAEDSTGSAVQQSGCAFWCTRSNAQSHCTHPECKACSICADTIACTPNAKTDLNHESCESWCNAAHAGAHCTACACKRCAYCRDGSGGRGDADDTPSPVAIAAPSTSSTDTFEPSQFASCKPTARDDGRVEACKPYCQDKYSAAHCTRCDCKKCGFCLNPGNMDSASAPASSSSFSAAVATTSTLSSVAPSAPAAACTPLDRNDLKYESCAQWCKSEHRGVHCSACACKRCSFCGGDSNPGGGGTSDVAALAAITGGGGKACEAASRDDGKVESCKGYCLERHAAAHCTRCDCKVGALACFAAHSQPSPYALPSSPHPHHHLIFFSPHLIHYPITSSSPPHPPPLTTFLPHRRRAASAPRPAPATHTTNPTPRSRRVTASALPRAPLTIARCADVRVAPFVRVRRPCKSPPRASRPRRMMSASPRVNDSATRSMLPPTALSADAASAPSARKARVAEVVVEAAEVVVEEVVVVGRLLRRHHLTRHARRWRNAARGLRA